VSWTPLAVVWSGPAEREIAALDRPIATRIYRAVGRYAETGEGDVKRLQGFEREWRLRVGSWRVRFKLDHGVIVLHVVLRKDAYR
jgi:mRNA interferase RelE/StbE